MYLVNQLDFSKVIIKYVGWSDPEDGVCLGFLRDVCGESSSKTLNILKALYHLVNL